MLTLRSVGKSYAGTPVLTDISLRAAPGESICITGDSGSGKSTLLRLLLAQEAPTSGSIEVDNAPLASLPPPLLQLYRRRVGVIFQEPWLLPEATVAENVGYPLEVQDMAPREREERVQKMLARLELAGKAAAFPAHLSSAERCLAQLGRALITNPLIVYADEPLALLDTHHAHIALLLLKEAHARGATVIVFSRTALLARHLSARTLRLERGRLAIAPEPDPQEVAAEHQIFEQSPMHGERASRKVKIVGIHETNHAGG